MSLEVADPPLLAWFQQREGSLSSSSLSSGHYPPNQRFPAQSVVASPLLTTKPAFSEKSSLTIHSANLSQALTLWPSGVATL